MNPSKVGSHREQGHTNKNRPIGKRRDHPIGPSSNMHPRIPQRTKKLKTKLAGEAYIRGATKRSDPVPKKGYIVPPGPEGGKV